MIRVDRMTSCQTHFAQKYAKVLKYWDTYKALIFHLSHMENLQFSGVPLLKHIRIS